MIRNRQIELSRQFCKEVVMKCFVIMPFRQEFDPVFNTVKEAVSNSISEVDFDCYWLKDVHSAGRITDDITAGLSESTFCIADLSGNNPNVMWETGYAMALGKPTILIGQEIDSLPFDLRSHRILPYSLTNLADLRPKLTKAVRDTLARYELKGTATELPSAAHPERMTIAVTGTMRANEAAVTRRMEVLLRPYLSEQTRWLVGSAGIVDVATAKFLIKHHQQLTAVGYNRFDCDTAMRQLIEGGKALFMDASIEQIPRLMKGPSERDILFCTKADLVVLFWDGKSGGTGEMVRFFQEQGVSMLLVFI